MHKKAVDIARRNLNGEGLEKFLIRKGNYADLLEILEEEELGKADIFFLDLGFSSEQLGNERGFSFQKNEPLLMTYNDDQIPAYTAIRQLKKRDLAKVIKEFSDDSRNSRWSPPRCHPNSPCSHERLDPLRRLHLLLQEQYVTSDAPGKRMQIRLSPDDADAEPRRPENLLGPDTA